VNQHTPPVLGVHNTKPLTSSAVLPVTDRHSSASGMQTGLRPPGQTVDGAPVREGGTYINSSLSTCPIKGYVTFGNMYTVTDGDTCWPYVRERTDFGVFSFYIFYEN